MDQNLKFFLRKSSIFSIIYQRNLKIILKKVRIQKIKLLTIGNLFFKEHFKRNRKKNKSNNYNNNNNNKMRSIMIIKMTHNCNRI